MNGQIIFASLRARPVRTFVSVLAVALEVVLILMIVGLTKGMTSETGKRIEGVGADIILLPPGSSFILSFNGSPMSTKLLDVVAKIDGVKAVTPVLMKLNTENGIEMVEGIDPAGFNEISGGFVFLSGRMFSAPGEVIVDDVFAADNRLSVGQSVHLLNQNYKVSGIVETGKGARVYMALPELQDLMGAAGKASWFYVTVNDPNRKSTSSGFKLDSQVVTAVSNRLQEKLGDGYQALNAQVYSQYMTGANLPGLDEFLSVVVFVAICVGVLVIFLSMYTTITERTREIGILRSLGASKMFVVVLILQETLVICLLGVVVGILGTSVIAVAAVKFHPTLAVTITNSWRLYAAIFAILSGLIGGIYPSAKAAAKDPIEALAYE